MRAPRERLIRLRLNMLAFLALCLLCRFAYSLNDIFTGRLARQFSRTEVGAWRGLTLGLVMAPLLIPVPLAAWKAMMAHWPELLLLLTLTAICNLLQLHAARFLPFGLRAAFIITGMSVGTFILGALFFQERLTPAQTGLCFVLVASAIAAALGSHASHEIQPNIPKGATLAVAAAVLMCFSAVLFARLSRATSPLLTVWAWELGAGLMLMLPLLWQTRARFAPGLLRRIWRIGWASSPTAIGSGASAVALKLGDLGIWGAVAGTQVLFTAALGAWWHRETIGTRRWLCFAVAGAAVAGLALLRN